MDTSDKSISFDPPEAPYEFPLAIPGLRYLGQETRDGGRHGWGLPWGFAIWHEPGGTVPTQWWYMGRLSSSDRLSILWRAGFMVRQPNGAPIAADGRTDDVEDTDGLKAYIFSIEASVAVRLQYPVIADDLEKAREMFEKGFSVEAAAAGFPRFVEIDREIVCDADISTIQGLEG